MDKAHQHASNADDYLAQGLLIPAAEEHYKAAEAFIACIKQTSNEKAKHTLNLLYNEHNKLGKSLQQRIAQLREAGIDPTLPQLPTPSRNTNTDITSTRRNASPGTRQDQAFPPARTPSHNRMSESSSSDRTIDDSFMVLGGRSDPGDQFNQFWNKLEGMLDQFTQAVVFASAPLHDENDAPVAAGPKPPPGVPGDNIHSGSEDTEPDEVSPPSRGFFAAAASAWGGKKRGSDSASTVRARKSSIRKDKDDPGDLIPDDDTSSSDSFYLIPSTASPSISKLQAENTALKAELSATQKRLVSSERAMKLRVEQEQQLREGINHVRREAQRAMASSVAGPIRPVQSAADVSVAMSLHSAAAAGVSPNPLIPHIPIPLPQISREKEAQMQRRIRELEEELKLCKAENEKQKVMITRFKERWEKLKESAKRKRGLKTADASGGVIKEAIEEEPEPEPDEANADATTK